MSEQERRNRLLEFLTAPVQPAGEASRSNRRRRSSARVLLSWDQDGEWRTIRGRLRDISRAGAGLLAVTAPPMTSHARLRLLEGQETPWIEAEIVGIEKERERRHRVRLRFLSPCPSFMLQPAILGQIAADDQRQEPPRDWVAWKPERTE
jgi:PilZ domain